MKRKVSSIALNALLLILGVVTVYPFVWMIFFILQGKSGDHGSGAASPSAEIHH